MMIKADHPLYQAVLAYLLVEFGALFVLRLRLLSRLHQVSRPSVLGLPSGVNEESVPLISMILRTPVNISILFSLSKWYP